MFNKIWLVMAVVVMGMLGGCAAISPTKVPAQITGTADFAYKLAKDGSGILYGAVWNSPLNKEVTSVKFACDAIHNSDERCSHPDDYVVGRIVPRSDNQMVTVVILMEKTKEIQVCTNFNSENCTYVKVKTEKNKLGVVMEVVSLPNEKKCHWDGGFWGGVICPNWNAKNEIRDFTADKMALTGVTN